MATEIPVKHDSTAQSHTPFNPGDKLPVDTIPVSADVGNQLSIGADSGLYVPPILGGEVVEGRAEAISSVGLTPANSPYRVPVTDATLLGGMLLDPNGAFIVPSDGLYVVQVTVEFSFGATGVAEQHRGRVAAFVQEEDSLNSVLGTHRLFGIPIVYTTGSSFEGEYPPVAQSASLYLPLKSGYKVGLYLENTQIFGDSGMPATGVVEHLYIRKVHSKLY